MRIGNIDIFVLKLKILKKKRKTYVMNILNTFHNLRINRYRSYIPV